MATATFVPVSEYLQTGYRPDRDYVDGELKERNVGERPHSEVQSFLAFLFMSNVTAWKVVALTEQRVQVSASRYRVPDVCVVGRSDPRDVIVRRAPLLCIEILSREDRMTELRERVDDYVAMGVQQTWVIDPVRRIGYMAGATGFVEPQDGVLSVDGTPIRVVLAELFAKVDALQLGS